MPPLPLPEVERECFVCHKRYTVTWRSLNALRCDDCAADETLPPQDHDPAEVDEIRRLIAERWRVVETPPMEDIDCIKEAQVLVNRICQGPTSNQQDELRILFYTVVGVVNTMNIKHGGRGVMIRMMKDMLDETAQHFPPDDRTGDTGGAPTIY